MVPVVLFRLEAQRVQAHLLLQGAHRDDAERLRLSTREQRRAVRARRHSDLDRDVADLALAASVRALLLDCDALADDRLLELVERQLNGCAPLLGGQQPILVGALGRGRGVLLEDRALNGLGGVLALELVLHLRRRVELCAVGGADRVEDRLIDGDRLEHFLLLADLRGELALQRAQLLDLRVGDVERVEDLRLGNLVGARLDHQDRLLGPGDDQVEFRAVLGVGEQRRLLGVDDEVAVDLADPHRSDGRRQRDVGDHQGG